MGQLAAADRAHGCDRRWRTWTSSSTNIWMAHSASGMDHTRLVAIQPAVSRCSSRRFGARQDRAIGFRYAQNAPPYGLRWASLQPTSLSCQKNRKPKTNLGKKKSDVSDEC